MNDIAQGTALSTEAEVTLIRTDGTPIATVIQSIATAFDGAPAIQASIRDVTEHNRIDHILKVKNLELEMARNSADKANQAKSDFLSSMSHELRSPLNAILGFAQLLESGTPTPTPIQRSNLLQILRAGWFLLDLINEILDLASIESGKLSISMEPTSLKNMLDGCREMMEPQASMRDIDMCFQEVDPLIFVAADPMRVKQVLINLLANAIKYNKAQGSVNVSYGPQGAGCIRISVQDTGQGLSEDKLSQLFQPFNRLGQEAGQEEGTGIGLVVSQRLAELMGGTIGAQSTVGAGSVFWIDLRTTDARAEAIKPDLPLRSANSTPNAEESVRTLLYVEDNQANMQLVEQLIARRPDMRLLEAGNGLQALVLARAHQPNVILMDINLPGINGIQTLRLLKEDPVTAHIPVMALSANAMPDDVAAGLNAGFFRYLTKPVRITEFMDALDAGLALARLSPPRPIVS
jgi:signal transduction histidine kinase/CheY-like chemotaxis protein